MSLNQFKKLDQLATFNSNSKNKKRKSFLKTFTLFIASKNRCLSLQFVFSFDYAL